MPESLPRDKSPEDPTTGRLDQLEQRRDQLWLLAYVLILLLAVSVFFMDQTTGGAPPSAGSSAHLLAILNSYAARISLLAIIITIVVYFRERSRYLRRLNRELVAHLGIQQESLVKTNRRLESLAKLSRVLVSELDLGQVLEETVDMAIAVTSARWGSVMLLDPEGKELTVAAGRGLSAEAVAARIPVGERICGWVAAHGEPVFLDSAHPDPRFAFTMTRGADIGWAISAPLSVHGRIVGVLNVSQPPGCRPLEPEDQRALLSFADQAALAIEVARLYGESRRQVKELHQAVDDLAQAQAQLVQSEKLASVGVLAGGVAHEINNPLMIIGGRIELLLMRKDLPPPVREDLERVGRESTRISEIVKNLLAFSRAHRARARERLDVNAVVENTLQLVGHPLSVANIEIVRDLGKDLPAVEGYAGQLEQVFVNLAVNAMHAMENGGVLTIQTRRNPGGVVVEFADTGSGIAEEHLRKIFDPFFTTKPEGKGTGLGLSVSFGIIEAHGGEIGVESQVGQGTRFQVRLPAMAALDHTQKETSSHEQDAR